jgi:hypothetical protein
MKDQSKADNINFRQYATHQQLLISQFVDNSPPHYPNTTHTNPPNHNPGTPTPTPTPTPTQTSATPNHHLGEDATFATQSGKGAHLASSILGTSAVSKSKASLTNTKASTPPRRTDLPRTPSLFVWPRMSTRVKIYTLQPQLDVPAQSRIRFPLWLKCLYNIAQMELTTVDPLKLSISLPWRLIGNYDPKTSWPEALFAHAPPLRCPTHIRPMPPLGPSALTYSIASINFELQQQRVTADLHSAICTSLDTVTLNEINSKHQFGRICEGKQRSKGQVDGRSLLSAHVV